VWFEIGKVKKEARKEKIIEVPINEKPITIT